MTRCVILWQLAWKLEPPAAWREDGRDEAEKPKGNNRGTNERDNVWKRNVRNKNEMTTYIPSTASSLKKKKKETAQNKHTACNDELMH